MPVIVQRRGPYQESVHPFSAVAVDLFGHTQWLGTPVSSPWRSAAKPFQLLCSLEALEREDFTDIELAIGASSHAAEPRHVRVVEALLHRFDLSPALLRCGAHWPLYHPAGEAEIARGGAITTLHSNCSGKHSFMLAACQAQGWPLDYRPPDHPLQRAIRARVTELCAAEPGQAVDGCGVPTFYLPIDAMARAWAQLGTAAVKRGDDPLGRIGRAMAEHVELTSGTGRLDMDVKAGAREAMIVKIGAGGVFCLAFPERGLGVAVKVHSGSGEALGTAVAHALERLVPGAFELPASWPWGVVSNIVGKPVGSYAIAHGELSW